jgi:hypothetical protein
MLLVFLEPALLEPFFFSSSSSYTVIKGLNLRGQVPNISSFEIFFSKA